MTNQSIRLVYALTWRFAVMLLCAAAVACTGWYVAWEGLFEVAFSTPLGWAVGCMCVSGFIGWLYIAADVFITLQDDCKRMWGDAVMAREHAASRRRLQLLIQSNPTDRNAKTILRSIGKVK